MKIALFVHCFFPDHFYGTETYTLGIARNLMRLGHEVTVISAVFPGEASRGRPVTESSVRGIRVITIDRNYYPNQRIKDTYYNYCLAETLQGIIIKIRPDIVHVTHLINHTSVLLEVIQSIGVPAVATFTDFFGFCFTNKLEDVTGSLCAGPSPTRSNCVACCLAVAGKNSISSPFLAFLRRRLPLPLVGWLLVQASRFSILPSVLSRFVVDVQERPNRLAELYKVYRHVVAPSFFLAKAYQANGFCSPMTVQWFGVDTDRQPKPLRLVDSPLRFAYIGQLAEHKGIDLLLAAFNRLQPCGAELLIYGRMDQGSGYTQKLRRLSRPQVHFHPTFSPECIAEILREVDVLVIPSRWYENSPLVLLNALATHTPVIVSRVEGMTEFVQDGLNGFAFDRGSEDDLTAVMQRFVGDPSLAARLSLTTSFDRTTEDMTADLMGVYKQVLQTGSTDQYSASS